MAKDIMNYYKALILIVLMFSTNIKLYASQSWQSDFYTDDSSYYLKLFDDGLELRYRVHRDVCNQIVSSKIIFKHEKYKSVNFRKSTPANLKKWQKLYGIDESDFCWFEVKVKNIDLNDYQYNQYIIEINSTVKNTPVYFTQISNSIMPIERLKENISDSDWITLGPLGSTVVEGGGVYFKIWEPYAEKVHLYDYLRGKTYQLNSNQLQNDPRRVHTIYIPSMKLNDQYQYKFIKNGIYETIQVANFETFSAVKVDPSANVIIYDAKGGKYNGYINPRSIISQKTNFRWRNDQKIQNLSYLEKLNLIIYQIWPLTFNPQKIAGRYRSGNYQDIINSIDYLDDLGVNAIELLPINENRLHGSWGYMLDSLNLLQPSYGSRTDLKQMVDKLHEKKMVVFLDIVLNHINNNLIRDPLSATTQVSKYYKGTTDWGPKPRFEFIMVQKWITDSLLYLARNFHIDGFRFDMTKFIYRNNPKAYTFLQELNQILKINNPSFYSSAEELPDNIMATLSPEQNGLGFDSQWNDKFKNFFEHNFDYYRENEREINLVPLRSSLLGFSNHWNYGKEYNFGNPLKTVNYLGSHDFIGNKNPLIRIISDYESYEWDGDNYFLRVRPLEDPMNTISNFRMVHNDFTHALARSAYGVLFTKPGALLFYQGEEIASDINIENEWSYINATNDNSYPSKNIDLNRFISSHRMPWEFLSPETYPEMSFLTKEEKILFLGHYTFFKDMIRFRRNNPSINFNNAKNVYIDYENSIVTYELSSTEDDYFVVVNFGYDHNAIWVRFPGSSEFWWSEIVTSSYTRYGGKNDSFANIISYQAGSENHIRMKGPSISVFNKHHSGKINYPLFLRGSFNNWEATSKSELKNQSSRGSLYAVDIICKQSGNFQFKLATKEWDIELGASPTARSKADNVGALTYETNKPNAQIYLLKGKYKFLFNLQDFKYSFIFIK